MIAPTTNPPVRLFDFDDAETCARAIAAALLRAVDDGLALRARATVALSGGRTPPIILPHLFAAERDWQRVTLTLSDDRWVAPESPDSNEGMVRRLARGTPAAAATVIGLRTGDADPADGVATTERRLDALSWPLDAAYLGIGADGHVASLFPGSDWAGTSGRVVAVPPPRDGAPDARSRARISLTPRALLDCRRVLLMMTGREKAVTLGRALQAGSARELPLRLVLHQDKVPVEIYRTA